MQISIKGNRVVLESEDIIWASAEVGYCAACKKKTAWGSRGPEFMVKKMEENLGLVGLVKGDSKLACMGCRKLVGKALGLVQSGKLKVVVRDVTNVAEEASDGGS